MQGWRISMEDAHAAVLDLQAESEKEFEAATADNRLSFFGVYDGHGGDKVAIFAGENMHKILAKQAAFREKNFEQALRDGFLATDRAILSGALLGSTFVEQDINCLRSEIRRGGVWLYSFRRAHLQYDNLCCEHIVLGEF